MKKFLDYNGLEKYTSLLNTSFAKLENGAVSEDVLPMSAKDVVEFDGFCDASVIIQSQTPLSGVYNVQYFTKGKKFVAYQENVLGYHNNFATSDLYQKTDGNSKQPYTNKIYVDISSDNSPLYRWNGTNLVRISDTSKLEWVNITDKPSLMTNMSDVTYNSTGLHFNVSYTQGLSKLIVIPEASSDSSGVITPDTYTYIELLKQSNAGVWSEFISRYGVVNANKIAGVTTDATIKLSIPYDTASDEGVQSNTQTVTFYGATTKNAGLMTANDKLKLDAAYDRQTFIFIDGYLETGELLQSSTALPVGRKSPVVYIASENALAVKINNLYYNNWADASDYGIQGSNGNWIPKNDTLYISTQNFSMYVYYNNKLNKIS